MMKEITASAPASGTPNARFMNRMISDFIVCVNSVE
jgi:hypothetical protein